MSESQEKSLPQSGTFSWNELISKTPEDSAAFYGKLFGWETIPFVPQGAPAGAPPYSMFKMPGASAEMGIAGMAAPMHPGAPTHWVPYVVVDDAEATLATATELGAQTIVPVISIGEIGRIAVVKDPQGAVIGFHEVPK